MTSPLTGIPTTRVSNLYAQQRLLAQLNFDQIELFRLQTQISTGQRLLVPSDDPSAATRGQALQSLLERKDQIKVNLDTNQSFLSATDAALTSVSSLLTSSYGSALGVVDTTSTQAQRDGVRAELNQAIQQLVDTGNQEFRERFLFSGTRSDAPAFDLVNGYVRYNGNEERLVSFSDIGVLFETNIDGNAVFGAISEPVRGTVDLNPALTDFTRLADLRGGRGVEPGSIVISDATNTSTIDLSGAETIGDVAALIEANPPSGRTVTATVTSTGLTISLDAGGGGNLTIDEVGAGHAAEQLGILETGGVLTGPLVGEDVDPRIRETTELANLVGGTLDQTSGLQITNGDETFVVDISTADTIEDVLNAINSAGASVTAQINEAGNGIDVRSRLSGADLYISENGGTTASDLGIRSFVGESDLDDLNHGLGVHTVTGTDFAIRRRDGAVLEFDASSFDTVQDVIDAINNHVDNQVPATQVTAQLAASGGGIELVTTDTATVATLSVLKRNGSEAAEDLGLIPVGASESDPPTGGGSTLTGRDVNPIEVEGAFNALIRLERALVTNDLREISRVTAQLDEANVGVNLARAELGARQQSVEALQLRLEDEKVELRTALSTQLDVDLAEAISNFTARQAALQATLQSAATISQLTLLDFL
ncbi:MAG: hypothetical protein DWQ42_08055 [Planctomycetota bacterium]|nr:MAG: hypothetical protein DWQ42_08055 [Planctomycetota bacterium]REK47271.1 MAG: hypothetical protein DWQ46_04555 [Planctomycetota bacterium]